MRHERSAEALCAEKKGTFSSIDQTCLVDRRGDTLQPSCLHSCGAVAMADEYGSCYDFERLGDGTFRERYRLSDACLANFDRFEKNCVSTICKDTKKWSEANGIFLGSNTAVEQVRTQDHRECRQHRTEGKCTTAACAWSPTETAVECANSGGGCAKACDAIGGEMHGAECVVPRCRPMKAVEKGGF